MVVGFENRTHSLAAWYGLSLFSPCASTELTLDTDRRQADVKFANGKDKLLGLEPKRCLRAGRA
jgi:hypothetical protein